MSSSTGIFSRKGLSFRVHQVQQRDLLRRCRLQQRDLRRGRIQQRDLLWFPGRLQRRDLLWFPDRLQRRDLLRFQADFSGATFDDANFSGATFYSSYANFGSVTFSSDADFSSATFSEYTDFSRATFGHEANFINAKMRGKTFFNEVVFARATSSFLVPSCTKGHVARHNMA